MFILLGDDPCALAGHSHDVLKCTRNAALTQSVRGYRQTSGFGERGPVYFGIDELVYVHAVVAPSTTRRSTEAQWKEMKNNG